MAPVLWSALVGLAGCPGPDTDTWPDPETDTEDTDTEDTDTDSDSDSDTAVDTDDTAVVETTHCGVVASDEVWTAAQNPHVVTCTVQLEGGSLTIEPGAQVFFLQNAGLVVSRDGFQSGLVAVGTEEAPIWFGPISGAGRGKWAGIRISRFAGNVVFEHATINGGGAGVSRDLVANLVVQDVPITLRDVTIEDSASYGALFTDAGRLQVGSEGLRFRNNYNFALSIDATQAHTLPAAGSDYTGNLVDAVRVESGVITVPVTWEDLGVPYGVDGVVDLEGIAIAPAILTIEPNVTVQFDTGSTLRASPADGASGIIARGTADRPILFTSMRSEVTRHWNGIEAWPATVDDQLVFEHVTIEWGGAHIINQTNLLVDATPILAKDLTVRQSWGAGARLIGHGAVFRDGSENIRMTENPWPMEIGASAVWSIPDDSGSSYRGNDIDRIAVIGNQVYYDQTWALPDVPLWVFRVVHVAGPDGRTAILTLPPGSQLMFDYQAELQVGTSPVLGDGGLYAVGTPASPVVFTAGGSYTYGAWKGLLLKGCVPGSTRLDEFEIGFAEDGIDLLPNSVTLGRSCGDAVIQNGWIHHSSKNGVVNAPEGFSLGENVVFENIRNDDGGEP
jgi:hypothetical protein